MNNSDTISAQQLQIMYTNMLTIREAEERLADMVATGQIQCPVHLYIGQEAVAVGVCAALNPDDYIFGNHRSHGHYLAKGGQLEPMMAEIFGKTAGCSRGRGGSMHLVAPEVGLMGTSAMVATGIPLAVGSAIAFAMQQTNRVAVTFFGDGAAEEGVFHESLNMAAHRKAPVVFVCENNQYSSHLPLEARRPADNIVAIAAQNNMPAVSVDGNNVIDVYHAAGQAIEIARRGEGPSFIECRTYRWRGHVGPNFDIDKGLRSQEELDSWMARDPIKHLEYILISQNILTLDQTNQIKTDIVAKIAQAITVAKTSDFPYPSELTDYVFSTPLGGSNA